MEPRGTGVSDLDGEGGLDFFNRIDRGVLFVSIPTEILSFFAVALSLFEDELDLLDPMCLLDGISSLTTSAISVSISLFVPFCRDRV